MIKIKFKNENPAFDLREAALNTINKTTNSNNITSENFKKYLLSEHSPIRAIELRITMYNIPYHVSTHFVRHVHAMHYVSTNRPDRTNKERSTNDTCNHIMDINIQALIDMARKRLCVGKVAPETYDVMLNIKNTLKSMEDENMMYGVIADYMVPNCVYRCGCPEFTSCNFIDTILDDSKSCVNIDERYQKYNNIIKNT